MICFNVGIFINIQKIILPITNTNSTVQFMLVSFFSISFIKNIHETFQFTHRRINFWENIGEIRKFTDLHEFNASTDSDIFIKKDVGQYKPDLCKRYAVIAGNNPRPSLQAKPHVHHCVQQRRHYGPSPNIAGNNAVITGNARHCGQRPAITAAAAKKTSDKKTNNKKTKIK